LKNNENISKICLIHLFFVLLQSDKNGKSMSESTLNKDLIQRLLEDRDAEYRRDVKAEQQVSELSDVAKL
jgi:hypothetical protein